MNFECLGKNVSLSLHIFNLPHEMDSNWQNQHKNEVEKYGEGLCHRGTHEYKRCEVGERNRSPWVQKQCIKSIAKVNIEAYQYQIVRKYN